MLAHQPGPWISLLFSVAILHVTATTATAAPVPPSSDSRPASPIDTLITAEPFTGPWASVSRTIASQLPSLPQRIPGQPAGPFDTNAWLATLTFDQTGPARVDLRRLADELQLDASSLIQAAEGGFLQCSIADIPIPVELNVSSSELRLYVPPRDRRLSSGNAVQITMGPSVAMVPVSMPSFPQDDATTGLRTWDFERNLVALLNAPGGLEEDVWLWEATVAGNAAFASKSYAFVLPDPPTPLSEAELTLELVSTGDLDNALEILLNQVSLGTPRWKGRAWQHVRFVVPASTLSRGTNRLSLTNSGDRGSTLYLNRFRVTASTPLRADSGPLEFEARNSGTAIVTGLASTNAVVWNVTDPFNPRLAAPIDFASTSPNSFNARFPVESGNHYTVSHQAQLHTHAGTALRTLVQPRWDTSTQRADYVLIVPAGWESSASILANWRASQGLTPLILSLPELQARFSQGFPTPAALRPFIERAQAWELPPRYVVLVGDGSYDYRKEHSSSDQWIPPELILTPFGRFPSDLGLGFAEHATTPNTIVGRLPVKSTNDLERLVRKLQAYEAASDPIKSSALLMADFPDAGGDFIGDGEDLANIWSGQIATESLYNRDGNSAHVRAALPVALRSNPAVWNYAGHGARDRLGTEYLVTADVASLPQSVAAPWLVAMTCGVGQFSVPGFDALTEELLRREDGGVIAAWAPAGYSFNLSARHLNHAFGRALIQSPEQQRLGDILQTTLELYQDQPADRALPRLYNLLGDPATLLRVGIRATSTPPIVSIVSDLNRGLALEWTGGRPPFRILASPRLDAPQWTVLTVQNARRFPIDLGQPALFYRVEGIP